MVAIKHRLSNWFFRLERNKDFLLKELYEIRPLFTAGILLLICIGSAARTIADAVNVASRNSAASTSTAPRRKCHLWVNGQMAGERLWSLQPDHCSSPSDKPVSYR